MRTHRTLPAAGRAAWGRTRVGLRCVQGPTPWNVYLPVTVKAVRARLGAGTPLPAGTVLEAGQLQQAEVDWAAAATPPVAEVDKLVGRQLARPLAAGAPVRAADVRQRQWFAAGDTVRLVARGQGFSVSGEGQALGPGIEGQPARAHRQRPRAHRHGGGREPHGGAAVTPAILAAPPRFAGAMPE